MVDVNVNNNDITGVQLSLQLCVVQLYGRCHVGAAGGVCNGPGVRDGVSAAGTARWEVRREQHPGHHQIVLNGVPWGLAVKARENCS